MICSKCRIKLHSLCTGGTWCDCQHRVPASESGPEMPVVDSAELARQITTAAIMTGEGAE